MCCTQLPKYLPGRETRSPDDFELFLECILEAPKGPRKVFNGYEYVPAFKNDPSAGQFPCGAAGCTTGCSTGRPTIVNAGATPACGPRGCSPAAVGTPGAEQYAPQIQPQPIPPGPAMPLANPAPATFPQLTPAPFQPVPLGNPMPTILPPVEPLRSPAPALPPGL
jgi:pilus assembly protein CpaC